MNYNFNISPAAARDEPSAADHEYDGIQPLHDLAETSVNTAVADHDNISTPMEGTNSTFTRKDRKATSFLDLPPELRNQVYEYALDDVYICHLAPRALARVSRSLRQETLALYCERVNTIQVELFSPKQERHFKDWVRYSMDYYPVLPHLDFYYYEHGSEGTGDPGSFVRLRCDRETRWPVRDMAFLMDHVPSPNASLALKNALEDRDVTSFLYNSYVNLLPGDKSMFPPTKDFVGAIKQRSSWVKREPLLASWTHANGFAGIDAVLRLSRKLAIRANGRDWDAHDLIQFAKFLSARRTPSMSEKVRGILRRIIWIK